MKRSGKVHNGILPIPHDQKIPSVQIKSQKNVAGFFYIRGNVHYECVPTAERVYSLEGLERLRENVRLKRPEFLANNSWILYHDNAPAHTTLSVKEVLATKQITVFEHPAYLPDVAPNYFIVSKDKGNIETKAFNDTDDIRSSEGESTNQYQNCFEGWTRRCHRCIAFQGECFEDNHGGFQQYCM
jgi:hypothetical protein